MDHSTVIDVALPPEIRDYIESAYRRGFSQCASDVATALILGASAGEVNYFARQVWDWRESQEPGATRHTDPPPSLWESIYREGQQHG